MFCRYCVLPLKSTNGLKLRFVVVLKYVGATHAVALNPFPDWSFQVLSAAQSVVVLVHLLAFNHIDKLVDTQPGFGGATCSILILSISTA
ncbi:MAG: hypothetical protein Q8S84_07470 [bacterium]|nr:hypothetical protein [bacterium]MDP3381286.1 hypothetical protein [bacterium]